MGAYRSNEMALTAAEKQKRYRERKKVTNVTRVVTNVTTEGTVTPEGVKPVVPANYGTPICECQHCQNYRRAGKPVAGLNHGACIKGQANRVSLPGDVDYQGVAQAEMSSDTATLACTCTDACPLPCKGKCGCLKCKQDYGDFQSLE